MTNLSSNHQRILELVKDLRFTDREQLTALMADVLKENGTEFALRSLVARGYLSKNLRNAHSPRSEEGLSRRRIVYYLAEQGRTYFGFTARQRQVLNWKVARLGTDMADLSHEVGISWFQTLAILGHRENLWDVSFKRGKHTAFSVDDHRHVPDAVATFTTPAGVFRRFVEFEHKNKIVKAVRHAHRYWDAFQAGVIDGRVLWITKKTEKLRTLRAAIAEEIPDAGPFFRFLSQEMIPLDPRKLLDQILFTTDAKEITLFPSRKSEERVA